MSAYLREVTKCSPPGALCLYLAVLTITSVSCFVVLLYLVP